MQLLITHCHLTYIIIHNVVNKASQRIGLTKRALVYLKEDMFIKQYKALVRPHLEFDNVKMVSIFKEEISGSRASSEEFYQTVKCART